MNTCKCNYCVEHKMKLREDIKTYMQKVTMQQEFEATCFMYEMVESNLKQAVDKYNGGKPLNNTQKQVLAKAIWRN